MGTDEPAKGSEGVSGAVDGPDTDRDVTAPARNIRLVLAYDGTPFLGWQVQPQGPTVQSILEEALGRITGHETKIKGSGRTDAGVHALGQVANFHTTARMATESFVPALNGMLPPEIAVLAAEAVDLTFDSQFMAVEKTYRYRVLNSRIKSPFEHRRSWQIPVDINIDSMREAAAHLIGTIDFSSFRAVGCVASSPVRTMREVLIFREGSIIAFELTANGFLRHMVRNIVGTLAEVGKGRFSTREFDAILEARDRTRAGKTAPPHGLYLAKVVYPSSTVNPPRSPLRKGG